MADARYNQAKVLYQQGHIEDASRLMSDLLDGEPENVGARYVLAICLTDLGRNSEAKMHLRQVLTMHPGHYEAAYRLGCLLQDERDFHQAAEVFRKVLTITDFQDSKDRLEYCESAATAGTLIHQPPQSSETIMALEPRSGNVITPGPPPVRRMIETSQVADSGTLLMVANLKIRHVIIDTFIRIAVGGAVALLVGLFLLDSPGLSSLVWGMYLLISLLIVSVKSRMNTTKLYEYGMDVSSGVLNRSKQFIWYYQITQPPTYLRDLKSYLSHTASLKVSYNSTTTLDAAEIDLIGIGTPKEVEEVRVYLQSRIPSERLPIRGQWT